MSTESQIHVGKSSTSGYCCCDHEFIRSPLPLLLSCAFMHTSSGWNQQPGHLDQGPTTPPPRPPTLESLAGGKKIRVTWSDGEESTYHAVWLRHNCRCPKCWGESSDQKLVSSFGGTDELQPDEMIVSSVRSKWMFGPCEEEKMDDVFHSPSREVSFLARLSSKLAVRWQLHILLAVLSLRRMCKLISTHVL